MTPSPNPMPAAVPPKKPNSARGCLIALGIVGGLAAIVCLVSGFFVWRAAQSEDGQKVLKAIGKGASLATKGLNAPGAQEARDLGCPEAFVLDMKDMMELIGIFDTDGGLKALEGAGPTTMLMCQGYGDLPTCDELARAYVDAPGRSRGEFVVLVQTKTSKVKQCAVRYADDGTSLGDFDDGKKSKRRRD